MAAKATKKSYPLRLNAEVMDAMQRWADDDLRSMNAQIEYVLRDALRRAGRLKRPQEPQAAEEDTDEPFLVRRPSSGEDADDEELFPVRRQPE